MLDGDGSIYGNKIGMCSYANRGMDLKAIYTLASWNGIFSSLSGNDISFMNLLKDELSLRKYKRWDRLNEKNIDRNSSNKAELIRFKEIDDVFYVRVKSIEYTGLVAPMMDIETTTHYFNCSGVEVHNCEYYDIPYLCGRLLGQYDRNNPRAEHIKERGYWTKKDLFTFGKVRKYTKQGMFGKNEVRYEILGLIVLDYIDLYKKFTYTPPDYKLNTIANIELGDTKVDYSEVKHLEELYHTDYTKFVDYGIKDAQLVRRLDDKLQLINLGITLAYLTGINVNDVYSPVKMWEVYLYNEMLKDKIVPPWKRTNNKRDSFVGAFVKDPLKGKHKWVMSFDLASLHPSIMRQCNMSPDTHVPYDKQPEDIKVLYDKYNEDVEKSVHLHTLEKEDLSLLKKHNLSMSPNGGMFRRDRRGVIPKIIDGLAEQRTATKTKMLQKKQELEDLKNSF